MTSEDRGLVDENQIIAERRAKLAALRAAGQVYPNDFHRDALADDLHEAHDGKEDAVLEGAAIRVAVAGRMLLKRVMGKACFATLADMSGRIQLYVTLDAIGEALRRLSSTGTSATSSARPACCSRPGRAS